jgi:hypothetical protein
MPIKLAGGSPVKENLRNFSLPLLSLEVRFRVRVKFKERIRGRVRVRV